MGKYLLAGTLALLLFGSSALAGGQSWKSRKSSRATSKTHKKLKSIVIPKLQFEDVPVSVIFEFLKRRSRELDPDGEGVNFVVILKAPEKKKIASK